jgi:hypothetical protein
LGITSNCNNKEAFFNVSTLQYISFHKIKPQLWMFPVHALFKGPKYKNKKSMLYNNTSVCIEGLLSNIELDKNTGVPSFFHILVDNIGFLGKSFPLKYKNSD